MFIALLGIALIARAGFPILPASCVDPYLVRQLRCMLAIVLAVRCGSTAEAITATDHRPMLKLDSGVCDKPWTVNEAISASKDLLVEWQDTYGSYGRFKIERISTLTVASLEL
jgi:hypothetical protein